MKWQVDEMTGWRNDRLMRSLNEMTGWLNDSSTKWQVCEIKRCLNFQFKNDQLTKWLADKMPS